LDFPCPIAFGPPRIAYNRATSFFLSGVRRRHEALRQWATAG
jgi:hypothetical protein